MSENALDQTHANDAHSEHGHEFHLVDPSPWPILASFSLLLMAGGAAFFFHKVPNAQYVSILGFLGVVYVAFRWWRDCINEGKAAHSAHTAPVRHGLRIGMALFIISEVMFFFAFFFSFFHSALTPLEILDGTWPKAPGMFPPKDMKIIDAWHLPLFNTLLLLLSGTTVTWAHAALLNNNRRDLIRGLSFTIILGLTFTSVQAYEYHHAFTELFKFSDNNYSANFYMATGFHGLHVLLGTIFLIVCLIRAIRGSFTEKHHLGFEFAAWYWHFVDVVWLFLFSFVYVWAGWGHAAPAS